MSSGLAFWAQAAMAAWAAVAGVRILFQGLRRTSRRPGRPAPPAANEAQALAELLATTSSSPLAREQVQARLHKLATEIAVLARDGHWAEPQRGCLQAFLAEHAALAAYFAEDNSRAKPGARKTQARTFLTRTTDVVGLLERQRHSRTGGSP